MLDALRVSFGSRVAVLQVWGVGLILSGTLIPKPSNVNPALNPSVLGLAV